MKKILSFLAVVSFAYNVNAQFSSHYHYWAMAVMAEDWLLTN